MSDTGDRTDTNVLVDEIIRSKVYECIVWLDRVFVCPLPQLCQLTHRNILHSFEYFYQIVWLLLELRIICERVELAVDSSSPAGYLIVHNVDFLELFLELVVVALLPADHVLHF